jgi:geranylgeranyl diphosphate synthase type II
MLYHNQTEQALQLHVERAIGPSAPPRLIAAVRHAVFSGGARIRPQLCSAVAGACGADAPELTQAAGVAIELMHCASLVHDDMPAFDNADTRRGKPSVHKAYGEPLALLTGDALIVMAYQVLLNAGKSHPQRLIALMDTLSAAVGVPNGIVAGQAWECESRADLGQYQRAKTGSLFVAATCSGALSAGADSEPWQALGECLGEAYQVADDIRDVIGEAQALGKPVGQDAQHARPSVAHALGLGGAITYFEYLIQRAVDAVPEGPSSEALQKIVRQESERLVPSSTCVAYRHSNVGLVNQAGGQHATT